LGSRYWTAPTRGPWRAPWRWLDGQFAVQVNVAGGVLLEAKVPVKPKLVDDPGLIAPS
jgi:hypothetical protein